MLKGRYFPDGDFWNATCPRSASYTWRSILYGKKLVEKGVLCGISDGATTRIIQDRWIPGVHPCLVKPLVPLTEGQTVASLIESRSWDEAAVRAVFDEDFANKVLQIPISRFGGDDFITWPHNRLGIYTVLSAYFISWLKRILHRNLEVGVVAACHRAIEMKRRAGSLCGRSVH